MKPDSHILVVEDHADTRAVMRSLLEAEGYRVTCAANGQEALKHLHESEPPCVILLDLNMPVMNGWQFGKELRRDPELSSIAVLVISAEENLAQTATLLGAAGYCWKPVKLNWLLDQIRHLCA